MDHQNYDACSFPDNEAVPVNDPEWRGPRLQPDPGQLCLCAELEYCSGDCSDSVYSCSGWWPLLFPFRFIVIVAGVLCQELLQRSKGRERGWQRVQDENLMLVKKFWLCFNRYSRPLCQCVLGVHSVLYRWQIQISRKFVHIPITKYQRGGQPIYTDNGLEVKEMVETAPWAIIKSTSIYILV